MQSPFLIRRVAVLGAGVMGAQIASHCTNAGYKTYLFDLKSEGSNPYKMVQDSLKRLTKLKPSPLAESVSLIEACIYEQDLEKLVSCDIVIEAVAERLDIKESLYQKITPHLGEHTVLVSNTSGLSINSLKSVLPESMHERFCGVHFFNPPRYMHLAELIPCDSTAPALLDNLETWLTSGLGKGVVRAKDTPNFIANRVGVFSLLATLYHAERLGLAPDKVDALTGVLLGRPKSATYRTMDVVGLDTLKHVVHTMEEHLKDDPWHQYYALPAWLVELIDAGALGQKSGRGVFRKQGKIIEVYDPQSKTYRATESDLVPAALKQALKQKSQQDIFKALLALEGPEAELILACFRDVFHYCVYHLEDIADSARQVDEAIKWGFGWQLGPFETWQAFGEEAVRDWLQASISDNLTMCEAALPKVSFAAEPSKLAVYQKQHVKPLGVLYENEGVVLKSLPDDLALISFKSKANTMGSQVLEGIQGALDVVEASGQGMIIMQQDPMNFSSGADLSLVLQDIEASNFASLSHMVKAFQATLMRVKYASVPVVAALRGRALGGGCELVMQTDAVVAAFESYPALVEVGVGLIPAGGGCKELLLRATQSASPDVMSVLTPYFERTAMAHVPGSALQAKAEGYLRAADSIVMHQEEVLFAAIAKIKALQAASYRPPLERQIRVPGRDGFARLEALLANYKAGGFISEHDTLIATKLAEVMTGGDVDQNTMVDEAWLLKLEHDAFMALLETEKTQARIKHMLEKGRPLRN